MKLNINEKLTKRQINDKVKDYIQERCASMYYVFSDDPERYGIEDGSAEYEYFNQMIDKYLTSMLKTINRRYYSS